jgi:hypothetical protein
MCRHRVSGFIPRVEERKSNSRNTSPQITSFALPFGFSLAALWKVFMIISLVWSIVVVTSG